MLQCVEGIYREGKIELLERPGRIEAARVIVAFLPQEPAPKEAPPFSVAEAAELRWRLGAIVEDWERPEMDVYDEL